MKPEITWLGHSTVLVKAGKTVVVDPWKVQRTQVADLVLITHSHHDHCSNEDVQKILLEGGTVIGTPDALEQLEAETKIPIAPGEQKDLGWVQIEAVPAYNINKEFHPKKNNWVGFILRFPEESIYIAGDTDVIPEMDAIKADTAILPVGGTYTMNPTEAAEAVKKIGPKRAIPIHYGDIVGEKADAELFVKSVTTAEATIIDPVA